MTDYQLLKSEYDTDRDSYLASIHPACRPAHHIAWPSFAAWLIDRGHEPPTLDFSDPYLARRLDQYLAFRENELGRLAPEARAGVEPHFVAFADWLHGVEVEEHYFGAGASGTHDEEP